MGIIVMQHNVRGHAFAVLAALWMVGLPGHAESLRCSGGGVVEGDSRLSVASKCGEPKLKDSFCAPLYETGQPVPWPYGTPLPCMVIDEWLYDRGAGNLMVTVRFRSGVVQSIVYGREPR